MFGLVAARCTAYCAVVGSSNTILQRRALLTQIHWFSVVMMQWEGSKLVPWQQAYVTLGIVVSERIDRPATMQLPLWRLHYIQRSLHENPQLNATSV